MEGNNKNQKVNLFGSHIKSDNAKMTNPFASDSFELQTTNGNPFFVNQQQVPDSPTVGRRLNNYDSDILNNTTSESKESIDYRVKEKEAQLQELDSKIQTADSYGTQNEGLSLRAKKRRLLQEIESLKKQQKYANRPIGGGKSKKKLPFLQSTAHFISKNILAKISPNIKSVVVLSDSLDKLSEINESIDELLNMDVPYGEKTRNYETLTNYLNKANVIHSKITKTLGKI